MDPRHLVQLAAILEKGSMSRASQQLHLSQPTLTHNMQILEMQAGGRLFERSRLGVRSTPLGEQLAREGRSIARGLKDAQLVTNRHKQGFQEQVRIGSGNLIGAALLPLVVDELMRERPGLSLSLQGDRPQVLVDRLIDGDYDLVIGPSQLDRPPLGIVRSLLLPDRLAVFCGAAHRLATKGTLRFGDAAGEQWVTQLGTDSPFARDTIELLAEIGAEQAPTAVSVVGEVTTLMHILSLGRHLAVMPRFPVKVLGRWFPIVELPMDLPPRPRQLHLWYRESASAEPSLMAVKASVERLAQQLAATVDGPASTSGSQEAAVRR